MYSAHSYVERIVIGVKCPESGLLCDLGQEANLSFPHVQRRNMITATRDVVRVTCVLSAKPESV